MSAHTPSTPDAVHDIILSHLFFKDINPHYVHFLADCTSFERFGPEQDIFRDGRHADRLCVKQTSERPIRRNLRCNPV